MNRRGSALVWASALFIIFAIGIVYIAMTPGYTAIFDALSPGLSGDELTTANKLRAIWSMWPIFLIIGVFVGVFIKLAKDDTGQGF
jgi:H+/Cl- antiporter ClcA